MTKMMFELSVTHSLRMIEYIAYSVPGEAAPSVVHTSNVPTSNTKLLGADHTETNLESSL